MGTSKSQRSSYKAAFFLDFYFNMESENKNPRNRKTPEKNIEPIKEGSPWTLDMGQKSNRQDIVSITYEEIGFFPRSFSRVLDRFLKQVFSDVENLVIQEYRFYRYLFLTTLKCVLILFFVPFLVNSISKAYLISPLTEYFWNTQQTEIFLNSYQQKRAFTELKDFEEKLYFESLIPSVSKICRFDDITDKKSNQDSLSQSLNSMTLESIEGRTRGEVRSLSPDSCADFLEKNQSRPTEGGSTLNLEDLVHDEAKPNLEDLPMQNPQSLLQNQIIKTINFQKRGDLSSVEQRLQEKTIELAIRYNKQSIEAITNFFADLLSFLTLCYLLMVLEIQINITKSFLLEVFFGLDDSKKSLVILLITDLLVGYHSSNLWELFFEFLFNHYGLPESQTGIFLLVATLPVLLDVLFKYLIFRHLNRSSPATVATYHAMIE
jgi:hypothetical protein